MGVGAGILVAALGAVLAFAVHVNVSGIDLQVVGVILIIAGVAGVLLDLFLFAPRRRQPTDYGRPGDYRQTTEYRRNGYDR